MIAIIDYGAGNLFSVKNALNALGQDSVFTKDPEEIRAADKLSLPGVGAFPDAMDKLTACGLIPVIREQAEQKPLLGICLGMQMLFEQSEEFGETAGLGLIPGRVVPIETSYKIPHMGWNELVIPRESKLLYGIKPGEFVYFVHSFAAKTPMEYVSAYCEYGTVIPALVEKENVYGAQFHPEKSGRAGLTILKNFCSL